MTTEAGTQKLITTPIRARDPSEGEAVPMPVTDKTPAGMMALAIMHNADPSVLGKLLDVQERWEAMQARKAFTEAMTSFKAECPAVLNRDATVDFSSSKGRTHYRHATLGGIVAAITPMLSKNGLSIGWETQQGEQSVTVTCNITHRQGHREATTLRGPRDESGNKNLIQAVGSAVTYLQRYTLLSALGLATADQDDDGFAAEVAERRAAAGTKAADILNQKRTTAPAASQQAEQPRGEESQVPAGTSVVTGKIEGVVKTPGKKKDGTPWLRYGVTINGVTYGTFSETHGTAAMDAHEANAEVDIEWQKEGKYFNLVGIRLAGQEAPASHSQENNSDLFPNE